ncbi:MAG: 50S ribosomal protein L22 [Thermoleophilaceae bacterium]|jgi:ribosomal protein L22|nr:50S ribosomal protein L22 [Thermoleophilaceae bacterium]
MAEETKYAEMTVEELRAELEKRELPKSGNKDELITRLEDDDTAQGGTAPENRAPVEAADEKPAEKKPARRRGAAETTTSTRRDRDDARPAPRGADGTIEVRAKAKYVRIAPRKARLVMDHVRGKNVGDARALLKHTPRAAAGDIAKLLESAVANAENNFELDPDELKIARAFVDEGPTIKRFQPRALGRATPIKKRTSHMTITLTTTKEDGR